MNRREFNTLMATTVASVLVAGKAAFAAEKDDKDSCKGKNGCGSKPGAGKSTKTKDHCKSNSKGANHCSAKAGAKPVVKKPAAHETPKS